jgi:hypothetical protein
MRNMREDWPEIRARPRAGAYDCRRCRARHADRYVERLANQSLSTALRHAQDAWESEARYWPEAEWPGGDIKLPGRFSGWSRPTPLNDVVSATSGVFTLSKAKLLYRIADGQPQPLYIGSAYTQTIQSRVMKEIGELRARNWIGVTHTLKPFDYKTATLNDIPPKRRGEIEKLRLAAAKTSGQITVQYGKVEETSWYPVDSKLLHTFELALQVLERPQSYFSSSRTFEA